MLFGELRKAIRDTKGSPAIRMRLTPDGPQQRLVIQKNSILENLTLAFPGADKHTETGLHFDVNSGELSFLGTPDYEPEVEDDDALFV